MNLLALCSCPPVVCQRQGPAFCWERAGVWEKGDTLPAEVAAELPEAERQRCERHAWRRMGELS